MSFDVVFRSVDRQNGHATGAETTTFGTSRSSV
jgi:hypothetical protein